MKAKKNQKTGKWDIQFYYKTIKGERKQSTKRGFKTKREAEDWAYNFSLSQKGNLNMKFSNFVDIYIDDMQNKIRENTWISKRQIIDTKILPYFKDKRVCDISKSDIIKWQNEIQKLKNKQGELYAPTYLRSINSQLSCIFNHAVRYYNLRDNPVARVHSMGRKKSREMLYWTKEEYLKFAQAIMDKPISFFAFELMFYTGIRCGELLALTPADFNFEKKILSINKSYQRIRGEDVITEPKTEQSIRTISMPDFLAKEMQDCINSIYGIKDDMRIFMITKSYLHHEMDRGAKSAGVKRIRIHDLRHSHISLLINMGFTAAEICQRVGHTSTVITDTYIHLFPNVQADIAKRLDEERKM